MQSKAHIIFVLIALFFSISGLSYGNAQCQRVATVKYEQQNGWSKKYNVNVTFMTGSQLNKATNSLNFSSFNNYALIFWGNGGTTIIKLSTTLFCGYEITCDCINNVILDLEGYDQDGDKWKLCVKDLCF
jgi:hypothetical protein